MSEFKRPRRYYLSQRLGARATGDSQIEGVWRAKQEAQPGTSLPVDFPNRVTLAAGGYTTVEDIDGADACELQRAGLRSRDAAAVFRALSILLST